MSKRHSPKEPALREQVGSGRFNGSQRENSIDLPVVADPLHLCNVAREEERSPIQLCRQLPRFLIHEATENEMTA